MAEAYLDPAVGGNGLRISDDANPETGLEDGGHQRLFVPAFSGLVGIAQFIAAKAAEVVAAALSVINSANTNATSSSNLTLATSGTIAFTLDQTGKEFTPGMTVGFSRLPPNAHQQMVVVLATFDKATGQGTGTIQSATAIGGPYSGWTVFRTQSGGGVPIQRTFTGGGLVTGGGDFTANRVLTVLAATASQIRQRISNMVAITPVGLAEAQLPLVLPDNGVTLTWDMQTQPAAECTLTGGDRTLATPSGAKKGLTYPLIVRQGDSGGRKLNLPGSVGVGRNGNPSWSVGTGKEDILFLYCLDDTAGAPRFRLGFNGDV